MTISVGDKLPDVKLVKATDQGPEAVQSADYFAGKKVALFGSYGWGDGEWMRTWLARAKAAGAVVFGEGLIQLEAPDEAAMKERVAQLEQILGKPVAH